MALLERVADSVYRLGTDWVGCYLIAAETVTVVDCGFPGYHAMFRKGLAELGRPLDSIGDIVLTHHHPDHVGAADRLRQETGATVHAPVGDAVEIRDGDSPLPPGLIANVWRPRMMRYMAHAARNGARSIEPVPELRTYADGDQLDAGAPLRAIHTPGHTSGHCALLLDDAAVLFAGDALATVSHLTGERGPRLLPFNESPDQARASLSRLEGLNAGVIAVGHGDPFRGSPAEAASAARLRS